MWAKGELKTGGEVGLSVYGEKADIKPLLGEGNRGDLTAIIAHTKRGTDSIRQVRTRLMQDPLFAYLYDVETGDQVEDDIFPLIDPSP